MKTAARIMVRALLIAVLLALGFAIGFPLGRQTGFMTGSEWAMVQAGIMARETGVATPAVCDNGELHVIVRQPADLYQRARYRASLGLAGVQMAGMEKREDREVPKLDN